MSNFSVQKSVNGQAQTLVSISSALSACGNEIRSAQTSLLRRNSCTYQITGALNAAQANLNSLSCKSRNLANGLTNALNAYTAVERELTGSLGGWPFFAVKPESIKQESSIPDSDGAFTGNPLDFLKKALEKSKYAGSIVKSLDKLVDNVPSFSFLAPLLGYIGEATKAFSNKYTNGTEATIGLLGLLKKSTDVETGLFKFYEKYLHPYEALKLDQKFGGVMGALGVAGKATDSIKELINLYTVCGDANSSGYDKTAQFITTIGSGFDTAGKTYVTILGADKVLTFVSKKGNQILATDLGKLKYTLSDAAKSKIDNANMWIGLIDVGVSTLSGGVKRYGQVAADGVVDMGDVGSIGVYSSCKGLSTVISTGTFGLVDINGEQMAGNLESRADEWLTRENALTNYLHDTNNPTVLRFLAAEAGAVQILAEETADAATKVFNGAKSGIQACANWLFGRK